MQTVVRTILRLVLIQSRFTMRPLKICYRPYFGRFVSKDKGGISKRAYGCQEPRVRNPLVKATLFLPLPSTNVEIWQSFKKSQKKQSICYNRFIGSLLGRSQTTGNCLLATSHSPIPTSPDLNEIVFS